VVDDGDSFRTYVDELQPSYGDGERLPDGSEIEGYVVDAVIGKGGMGVVYSATHKVIGKRCAIKVLRSEVSSNQDTVQRFIQEARAVNQIGHPNIVDIFDFGRLPDGRCYHLMDLLVGESLRRRLRRGPLHASEAAAVLEGVTAALIAVHDKGFIHRDLKPDNIFLSTATQTEGATSPGEVKLLDFGLAKLMPEAGVAAFTTKTGVMLGTPEYMSPEQARAQRIDYRTDIYALGVVMFEILTGHRPFPSGPDAFTTLQYHAEEPPPSLAAMLPELPAEMVQLVDAMLAKEPGARPSLAAVRTVIKRLRTTQLPTTPASASLPAMELTPSRVGAEPLLPTGPIEAPPPLRRDVSQPIAAAGIPIDSFRPPPLPPPPTVEPHASGLALAHAPSHAGTTLGVPPPPKQPSSHPFIQTLPAPARGSRRTWLVVGGVLSIVAGIAVALVATGVLP
jgi:serine/threonine-protein kinase